MSGTSYVLCKYCNRMVDSSKEHDCKAKKQYLSKQKSEYLKKQKEIDRPLHTKKWRTLRRSIIVKDGGYCQRCYIKYNIYTFTALEIHHIKSRIEYPELMFDESNLVTLCHTCNAQLGLNGIDFEWNPTNRQSNQGNILG